MTRFLTDRYFWLTVALMVISIILIYVADTYIRGWLPPQGEWYLTYMTFQRLLFLIIVAIAAWRFGIRGGLTACLAIGLIVLPRVIEMTIGQWRPDLLAEYIIIGTIAVVLSWLIGNRKQAGEVLRESEEKYKGIFDKVPTSIILLDKDGQIVDVNPYHITHVGKGKATRKDYFMKNIVTHPSIVNAGLSETYARLLKGEPFDLKDVYFPTTTGGGDSYFNVKGVPTFKEGKVVGAITMREDITERKKAEEELKRSHKQLRALFTRLQSTREDERRRIVREIHDEMGQDLTALKIDLSWLAKRFSKGQEGLLDKTKSMLKRVDMAIETVRRISAELRPALLDDFGLVAAIELQAEEFQKLTGIKCEVILNPKEIILGQDLSTAIFRILQEILTNVARHAEATEVKINLKERDTKLVLKVRDNGKGITKKEISHPKSFGLLGMRERAHFWGGEVKILGRPDKGTTITASIPLKKEKLNADNSHR